MKGARLVVIAPVVLRFRVGGYGLTHRRMNVVIVVFRRGHPVTIVLRCIAVTCMTPYDPPPSELSYLASGAVPWKPWEEMEANIYAWQCDISPGRLVPTPILPVVQQQDSVL